MRWPGHAESRWLALYGAALQRLLASETATARAEMEQVLRDEIAYRRFRGESAAGLRASTLALLDLCRLAWSDSDRLARLERDRRLRRKGAPLMYRVLTDLRYGWRSLVRSPGYALTATAILTLAIGANATIFTLVEQLFLAPPPHVVEPDRLVRLNRTTEMSQFGSLAYPDYLHYRATNTVFDGLLAYDPDGFEVSLIAGDERRTQRAWFVSDNYFEVLGVAPARGRFFLPEENVVDAPAAVAVLSHGLWRELGGGDDLVGQTIRLNGHPFLVVGVAPRAFGGISPIESPPDLYVPITNQPVLTPLGGEYALKRVPGSTWVWLWSLGRLRADVSLEQAQAELSTLAAGLEREFPEWNEGWQITVSGSPRLHPPDGSSLGTVSRVLLIVVGIVLLVACANVAILLLARSSARLREAGLRKALGATRSRLTMLMLAEGVLLGLAGAVGGFFLAWATARAAFTMLPEALASEPRPGLAVFLFGAAVSLLAALLFTLLPARRVATRSPTRLLRGSAGRGGWSSQAALVVVQVALSTVLIVGGALLVRSLRSARAIDLGFETESRTVFSVNLRNHGYETEAIHEYLRRGLETLRGTPGVQSASAMYMVPFRGGWTSGFVVEGDPLVEESWRDCGFNLTAPGYFETLGIQIVRGRDFRASDREGAEPVAILNQTAAARFFPDRDPVGALLWRHLEEPPIRVVGVAADAEYYDIGEEPQTQAYVPLLQSSQPRIRFVVHRADPSEALVRSLAERLRTLDPDVALSEAVHLEEVVGRELGRFRTAATLVGLFAGLALFLSSVGLYGALSYLVTRSRREIGIRIALGALPAQVARRYLLRGAALVLGGAAIGLAAAVGLTRYLEHLLFEIRPLDPASFLLTPGVLAAVALVASFLPARRAMRIEPTRAIQQD